MRNDQPARPGVKTNHIEGAMGAIAPQKHAIDQDNGEFSAFHLSKPLVPTQNLKAHTVSSGQKISNTIPSLSDPKSGHTLHHAPASVSTSCGSSTVCARPIEPLLRHADDHANSQEARAVALSLPRSLSSRGSGQRGVSPLNSLQNIMKPLTPIQVTPLPRRISPPAHDNADDPIAEQWDKTPKRSIDASPTARPLLSRALLASARPLAMSRVPSTLSISIPSLQSLSLTTVKPDTLAHHRQLEEYNEVLANLAQSHDDVSHGRTGHGRSLDVDVEGYVPVKVDEIGVEWCFFCGREAGRTEMELVDLTGPLGASEQEEIGAGEQWVCRVQCEGQKLNYGNKTAREGSAREVGSMRVPLGREGSHLGREAEL